MTAENIAENVKKIKAASDRYGALLCGAVKTRTDDEITAAIKLGGNPRAAVIYRKGE